MKLSKEYGFVQRFLSKGPVYFTVILLCFVWTIPTFGLLISSVRDPVDINSTGWWTVFLPDPPNPVYTALEKDLNLAQTRVDRVQGDLDTAQAAVPSAQSALDEAQKVYDATQPTEDEAAVLDILNNASQDNRTLVALALMRERQVEPTQANADAAQTALANQNSELADALPAIVDASRRGVARAMVKLFEARALEDDAEIARWTATLEEGRANADADAQAMLAVFDNSTEDDQLLAGQALLAADAAASAVKAADDAASNLQDANPDLAAALDTLRGMDGAGPQAALALLNAQGNVIQAQDALSSAQTQMDAANKRLTDAQTALAQTNEPKNIGLFSKRWRQQWTLSNYDRVLSAEGMGNAFLNSLLVTIPAVVIPITIAAFAAYAFAWLEFPGRGFFFSVVVISMVIPLHIALIPILSIYVDIDLSGTYLGIWLAHTGFGMPLAIYLLYGYIATIPREVMEAAHIDGASPFTAFTRLIIPLSVPAIASFAIFQFLWVWNDLLVALVFLGTNEDVAVVTRKLSELVGSKGQSWEVLTAGAFITMIVPLIVFFSLQRYFVRGMMAGSVKG